MRTADGTQNRAGSIGEVDPSRPATLGPRGVLKRATVQDAGLTGRAFPANLFPDARLCRDRVHPGLRRNLSFGEPRMSSPHPFSLLDHLEPDGLASLTAGPTVLFVPCSNWAAPNLFDAKGHLDERAGFIRRLSNLLRPEFPSIDEAQQINLLIFDGDRTRSFRWPRNVPWHEFPVVDGPFFRSIDYSSQICSIFASDPEQAIAFGHLSSERTLAVLPTVEILIVQAETDIEKRFPVSRHDSSLDRFRRAACLYETSKCLERPAAKKLEYRKGELSWRDAHADFQEAFAYNERLRPWQRFLWSYHVNFRPIFGASIIAIAKTYTLEIVPGQDLPEIQYEPILERQWAALSNPWALQILFAMRRADAQGAPAFTTWDVDIGNGWRRRKWMGSGKYPPIWENYPEPDMDPQSFDRTAHLRTSSPGASELASGFVNAFFSLQEIDFIDETWMPSDNRVTEKGYAFLEMVPSQFDDPDLMLRWNGDDGLPLDAHIPAMDRWLHTAFRAAKVRANQSR